MFWVSPTDPVCTPLFQNHMALAAQGPIAVAEVERTTCTDQDQYVNMHKNELCIIGIARTHSMFAEGRAVTGVSYTSRTAARSAGRRRKAHRSSSSAGKNTHHFMLKTEHLPRYAREKHSPRGKT